MISTVPPVRAIITRARTKGGVSDHGILVAFATQFRTNMHT